VKSPLYVDVIEKPIIGMIYMFSTGTLTFAIMIETFVEIFCYCVFYFGDEPLPEVVLSHSFGQ
jgi:hypothetical protein